ncbi:pyruvate/2-oxoglutarate dehydrogenase complex dihydrolipoamide dehydrogenase (E3) component [Thiogranum longum]|uniref:Pyruvate/2-oxoglutarate dehydrogenase complex dihydrolipoamide dehydrogenase (E3) component n=1 Tax=Thiogranum longum TaxID=1537524 RepID=A0A4R1HEG6_9GAMM|nr:mercuric reductase [Thiogranum longum]TCK17729.1 pyruvate/2-oxoglutarate dehydrogenase complex dihydrolipoamide dehydrogenase (E3) component [Thiogranum longum]
MKARDLVILGGGAGGLVVASVAAQLGLKVTLIEKADKLGGDCLHYGCVPSKTLIHAARVASLMRRGPEFGLPACEADVDLGKVADHVQSVIERIQVHDDPERFRSYGCEVLFGMAAFINPRKVQVNDQVIRGRRFVIATGSQPFVPPIEGLQDAGYLTNEDLFALRDLPRRLVVLGGGPVGLEMAQAFARLGSQVTVVERLPHLLPQEDPEVADALRTQLESEGMVIHVATTVERVSRDGYTTLVGCSEGLTLETDALLVAVGRRPVVEGLGLDMAGVVHTEKGIPVDRRQRTSQKHIYACGDVCGPYPLTHMAEYQAGIVIGNAIFRVPKKTDYRVVPWVTYTDPELARVGMTEQQARDTGIEPEVLRFPFQDIDRAITDRETAGLAKLVVHKKKILGASILGPHAGELIHEIALAMKTGANIGDISATIHAYPTLAQVHRRTVNTFYGKKLFSPGTRRLVKWINRLVP